MSSTPKGERDGRTNFQTTGGDVGRQAEAHAPRVGRRRQDEFEDTESRGTRYLMAASTKLHDQPYVMGCMERWARWCIGVSGGEVSPTGRIMIGMRGNICPQWI